MHKLSLLGIIAAIVCFACKSHKQIIASAVETNVAKMKPSQIPNHPLVTGKDLDALLTDIGNERLVLLGEDTHGTSENYVWRAAITERLVREKGFTIVALEADWTDTYRLNNFIKDAKKDSSEAKLYLRQYDRWPSWLWNNQEFELLVKRIKAYNDSTAKKVSIYGLDVYSFEEALDTLITKFKDRTTLQIAQNVKQCLRPYHNDALEYQRAVRNGSANCGDAVNRLWLYVNNLLRSGNQQNEANFLLQQYGRVVFNGERYFRGTVHNRMGAWNIRDRHMYETVKSLLDHYGSDSKIIVWAHNTHIGDARFTDMPGRGRSNVAEMLRKEYGDENVYPVGFGSYQGNVIAAQKWDRAFQVMAFAPARSGSIEQLLHNDGAVNKVILSKEVENSPLLTKWLLQRAIGVVENPRQGLLGTYVTSLIPNRYNAFIYFEESHPCNGQLKPAKKIVPV